MKKFVVLVFVYCFSISIFGQMRPDGFTHKHITEREFIPYQKVEEKDVFWSKRLWRIIDTREKQNLIFRYPQMPLIKILHSAVLKNEVTAFDNTVLHGDKFLKILPVSQIEKIGVKKDTMWVKDPITLIDVPIYTEEKIDFTKIYRYKIKEDWFFNSLTSKLEVRIVGIAPLMSVFDDNNNYLGDETLYWIYYPDLRSILSKYEAYNPGNNAQRLSWDDIFEARFFASYIYKEDNVYDRNIQEYASKEDALYESERIKELLFNFEHDLWEY